MELKNKLQELKKLGRNNSKTKDIKNLASSMHEKMTDTQYFSNARKNYKMILKNAIKK